LWLQSHRSLSSLLTHLLKTSLDLSTILHLLLRQFIYYSSFIGDIFGIHMRIWFIPIKTSVIAICGLLISCRCRCLLRILLLTLLFHREYIRRIIWLRLHRIGIIRRWHQCTIIVTLHSLKEFNNQKDNSVLRIKTFQSFEILQSAQEEHL